MAKALDIEFCLICGSDQIDTYLDGGYTYEICPCCGNEAGYDSRSDSSDEWILLHRREWLYDRNAAWNVKEDKPRDPNWTPDEQLKSAGLTVPDKLDTHQ